MELVVASVDAVFNKADTPEFLLLQVGNVLPHLNIVAPCIFTTDVKTLVLIAALWSNSDAWIAIDDLVRSVRNTRRNGGVATHETKSDITGCDVIVSVAEGLIRIPWLQGTDVRTPADAGDCQCNEECAVGHGSHPFYPEPRQVVVGGAHPTGNGVHRGA